MTESKVVLVNKYDEVVFELEKQGDFYYRFPKSALSMVVDIGDEFYVKEIEVKTKGSNVLTR